MTSAASYLPTAGGDERDPAVLVPELSRRARGFATWAMLRHLGRQGVDAMVARHCALARRMAAKLAGEPGVAIVNDVVLNQAIVRFGAGLDAAAGDALTKRTIKHLQQDGVAYAGGAQWRGRWVMRISVISWSTTEDDADRAVSAMIDAYRRVRKEASDGR